MKCSVEDCDREIYLSWYCNPHYQMWRKYGRVETVVWGQTNHPLYFIWNDAKNKEKFCKEWSDFKIFLKDVGERPNKNYKLVKKDKTKLFDKNNFYWKEYIRKFEGETNNEFQTRRRLERERINPGQERNFQLKKEFGITFEQYNEKLAVQNFVCAICNEKETTRHHKSNKVKSLAVDHCHKTGKNRGLLCQRCNRVLGKIRDRIDLLDKMKAYLNAHNRS